MTDAPDLREALKPLASWLAARDGYGFDSELSPDEQAHYIGLAIDCLGHSGFADLVSQALAGARLVEPGHVQMPTSIDEAKTMWLIGERWMRDNAPEALRTDVERATLEARIKQLEASEAQTRQALEQKHLTAWKGWQEATARADALERAVTGLGEAARQGGLDMREACARACEARGAYFDAAPGYRDWKDAGRSYRAMAAELRTIKPTARAALAQQEKADA